MGSIADHLIVESMVKRREMLELVVLVLPFLLVLPSEANQILPESIIDNNRDGVQFYDPSESVEDSVSTTKHRGDWILSVLGEVMTRQNQRRSFLENYVSKDQDEKMRTMAFKERMDKEEIVHLKHEESQLQRIADNFQHPYTSSSSHLISKRQIIKNRTVITPTSCSTSGKCVMLGKFCPHPDIIRPKADASPAEFVSFVVQKHVSSPNNTTNKAHQVQFEEVLLNFGESFKLNENVFVVPKSGIYEFNFDGHRTATLESTLNISLRINGKDAVNAFSDFVEKHDFRNLISLHSLLKVKKGDRIDLFVNQGHLLRESIDAGNNHVVQHTQFTGKLLLEDDLSVDKRLTTTPVYFNVQKNVGFCNQKSSVPFEIVNVNVGEAFDLEGQKFVSPIAGIYEFIVKGFKMGDNDELNLSIRLNGNPVANTLADYLGYHSDFSHNFHASFSINSILKLEKGDQIDLFLEKGYLYDDMNHLTQFTGKLLLEYDHKSNYDGYFYVQKNALFSTANAVIPFEVEVLNIGRAFSLTEHFFRAPKSGVYEFNAAGVKHDHKRNLRIALRLNSKHVAYVWADYVQEHKFYTPFYLHCVVKIKEGDRIDLFNEGEESVVFDDQRKVTHFTGKLLFATNNID